MANRWQIKAAVEYGDAVDEYEGTVVISGGALDIRTTTGERMIWGPGQWSWARTILPAPMLEA